MKNFDWFNPTKLIFGKDTVGRIGVEIRNQNINKVLLIAGGGSIKKNGVYKSVADSLRRAAIDCFELWSVSPNPVLSKVKEAIEIIRKNHIQAVLAVGGGSVIDTAKSAAAGFFVENVWDIFASKLSIQVTKALPIFTVLTISASGSEMSPFAVITNQEKRQKWDIMGSALYPTVSIVDPSVQSTLPWHQTFNGAFDAISHIMEYYFTGQSSETTLSINESLLKTIVNLTDKLQQDGSDYNSRANFAWAATLALNGTSGAGMGTGDWACHRIEMVLSAINPAIAHGAGLAVVFPAWIRYCYDANPEFFKRWAQVLWNCNNIDSAIKSMKDKIKSWNGPTTLSELGINECQVGQIQELLAEFGTIGEVKKIEKQDVKALLSLMF